MRLASLSGETVSGPCRSHRDEHIHAPFTAAEPRSSAFPDALEAAAPSPETERRKSRMAEHGSDAVPGMRLDPNMSSTTNNTGRRSRTLMPERPVSNHLGTEELLATTGGTARYRT
jgi:hypothetical protein